MADEVIAVTTAPQSPRSFYIDWISALRSNRYKQCFWSYRDGKKSFCSLGLLLWVSAKKMNRVWDDLEGLPDFNDNEHMEWVGIPKQPFGHYGRWCSCKKTGSCLYCKLGKVSELNDLDKKSFSEIADFVEQEILPFVPESQL